MKPSVSKKTAIITAAGHGMGAAITRKLAKTGYQLALMSNSDGAMVLAKELNANSSNPEHLAITGSVENMQDLEELVKCTQEKFGRIDAVVNNTGHPPKGDLLEISDQEWRQGFDLLLLNVIRMARLITPIMQTQGSGVIVNISTFAAFEPDLAFPVSCSLRAALASFSKLYSDRYASAGIRMNNILPGYIDSYPELQDNIDKIPLGRYGSVEEIANIVEFLISEKSAYITGQNIRVDGGLTRSV
jgi:NAD(P)-dependent dehydrogenase (short-subunit alcohol dehydrogenase family)